MTWKEIKDIILRKQRKNLNVIVFMLQRSKIISLKIIETKRSEVLQRKSWEKPASLPRGPQMYYGRPLFAIWSQEHFKKSTMILFSFLKCKLIMLIFLGNLIHPASLFFHAQLAHFTSDRAEAKGRFVSTQTPGGYKRLLQSWVQNFLRYCFRIRQ